MLSLTALLAAGYDLASTGSVGPQFADLDDVWSNPSWNASHVKITDPTIYLLNQARELMFRTALAQGNSSMIESVKSATQVRKASIYISHYDFLGIAVAISTMSLGVVLVTFHGYWSVASHAPLLVPLTDTENIGTSDVKSHSVLSK